MSDYRDPEWLRERYVGRRESTYDMAEEAGVSAVTIQNWLRRHGIDRERPWRDADRLREAYVTDGLSAREIARRWDCSKTVVLKWLEKHGIERRRTGAPANKTATFRTGEQGYEYWWCWSGGGSAVAVHQLLAVANGADPDRVFSGGDYHVHHRNGVPWDNRPENVELLTRQEHNTISGRGVSCHA